MEILRPISFPKTVDISLTGKCQLDCAWCWGEEHTIGTIHGENAWKHMLRRFKEVGTTSVVFTGGESLMSPLLPSVLRYAKESLDMHTGLSTNAILLNNQHKDILPWVDNLGLPLDGSTPEVNKRMRAGKIDNFQKVIDGIKLVRNSYPHIDLTVRTVIARPNILDVKNIPMTLAQHDIDMSHICYKLYQVEPIGPRSKVVNSEEWRVDENECRLVESTIREHYPNLLVTLQLYKDTTGRYYQIGPLGNAYGTNINKEGNPNMIELGNPINNFDHALEMITTSYSFMLTH
jgi:Fe-coproporphyrin III synthase